MKLEEQTVATFGMGIKETSQANIHVNAKMFEILSGVYSDPELAIVREIAANAWDSHKKAGYPDRQFDVQIPNALDPRFCVRDYGTSMTHEFVMNNLNTYGESSKDDSNEEIGGFGLGIKCPFSYTSSFMIACYMDGIRRVYAYQIGAKGIPEINFMAETATDEDDGVEISIPVKHEDYGKFSSAIQKTFAFYDVKPNIRGVDLNIPEFDKVIAGERWFVCERNKIFDNAVYVEMGGIAYPVDTRTHNINYYGYSQSLFIKANIGDIDITPNREQVKLTDKTTNFIKASILQLKQEIFDEMQKKVNDLQAADYWDIVPLLSGMNGSMVKDLGLDVTKIKFNGKAYTETTFEVRKQPEPIIKEDGTSDPVTVLDCMVPDITRIGTWERASEHRVKKYYDNWRGDVLNVNRLSTNNYQIVVMEERQSIHLGRWMRAQGGRDKVAVVHAKEGKVQDVIDAIKARTENYPEIFAAEDLEVEKVDKGAAERKFYIYHTGMYEAISRTEVDMSVLGSEIYYFETDGRQRGNVFGKDIAFKDSNEFVRIAREWLDNERIYYLTEALIKKIQKQRPDVKMIKAVDELEARLKDKVIKAADKYVINSIDTLEDFFANKIGRWSVTSTLNFWARRYGFEDYIAARDELEKSSNDRNVEKMCSVIAKKSIHELFEEYGIEVKKVTCKSFDELLVKMPYVASLARDYSDAAVLTHIESVMGWVPLAGAPAPDEDDDDD